MPSKRIISSLVRPHLFWRQLRIQTKLSIFVAFAAVLAALLVGGASISRIENERLSSLELATKERAYSLAMHARSILSELNASKEEFSLTKDNFDAFKKWKLPRWPVSGELLVAEIDNRPTLIGRSDNKTFWKKKIENLPSPWVTFDKVSYWFTAQGVYLGSSAKTVDLVSYSQRLPVQLYERSSGETGGQHLRPAYGRIYAAFHEVPNTNVVVVVESPIDQISTNTKQLLALIALIFILIVSLSYFIAMVAATNFIHPLGTILATLHKFSVGDYAYSPTYKNQDEISDLFAVVHEMGGLLRDREHSLRSLRIGMERLLVGSREMTLVHDRSTVMAIASSVALASISLTEGSNGWVYLSHDSAASALYLTAQVVARGRLQQVILAAGACLHYPNSSKILREPGSYLDAATGFLIVPIVHNEKSRGFFVFDNYRHSVLFPDEKTLLDALGNSVAIALHNIEMLEDAKQIARMEGEALAVKTLHENLIPRKIALNHVSILTAFLPAEMAGGDWFDFFHCETDAHLYICLGDVTGHGIPSAMMTAVTFGSMSAASSIILKTQNRMITPDVKLKKLAEVVNEVFIKAAQGTFFMTMVFVAIDLKSGGVKIVNAGHPPIFWVNRKTRKTGPLAVGGNPLGLQHEPNFGFLSAQLNEGDGLFFLTDGLYENSGPGNSRLSKKAIAQILTDSAPEQAVASVLSRAKSVWLNSPPGDDVTAVIVNWKATKQDSLNT